MPERLLVTAFDEELKTSYLEYAMTVIADRALPDARDGLKPVQRRILHAMNELGLDSGGPHKKSARIVGETMGKFHPHGDSSIYDAMARMAQNFSMRVPLVDGQGNFGSIDGDSPAAMRYTEARLSSAGETMQSDIAEDTVDFVPNFDESLKEPEVLPSALPNLLVNGCSGIAVGMATNIPPHNPAEVASLVEKYIASGGKMDVAEMACILPGPDFPTGGEISSSGVAEMYATGRGKFVLRAKTHIEETKNRNLFVVDEIPYGTSKERIVEQMAKTLQDKNVDGIVAVRDESDRTGNRVVVEMHRRTNPDEVGRLLLASTQLSVSFGGNLVALVKHEGRLVPRTMTLRELLESWIGHRRATTTRRTAFRMKRDKARLHIVDGLLKALDILDKVIAAIRSSRSTKEAKAKLVSMEFSDVQSDAILDMRLARLTGLEKDALVAEGKKLSKLIAEYADILSKPKKLDALIVSELKTVVSGLESAGLCERKTSFFEEESRPKGKGKSSPGQMDLSFERPSPCIVSIGSDGCIRKKDVKRRPQSTDGVYFSNGLVYALSFDGRLYSREKKSIPDISTKKMTPCTEFFGAPSDEPLILVSPDEHDVVFFVLSDGSAKKMSMDALKGDTTRKNSSKKIFPCSDGEKLFRILPGSSESDIFFVTAKGRAIRASSESFREQGAGGRGVSGITVDFDDGDFLADAVLLDSSVKTVVLGCKGGLFASFLASDMKTTNRGGKGMYVHRGDKPSAGTVEFVVPCTPGRKICHGEKEFPCGAVPLREISVHTRLSMVTLDELETISKDFVEETAAVDGSDDLEPEIGDEEERVGDSHREDSPDGTADGSDENNGNDENDEEGENS